MEKIQRVESFNLFKFQQWVIYNQLVNKLIKCTCKRSHSYTQSKTITFAIPKIAVILAKPDASIVFVKEFDH